jgi:hypothetical protein
MKFSFSGSARGILIPLLFFASAPLSLFALEKSDLMGFWEGWVDGRAFPGGRSKVVVEMWEEGRKVTGIQGNLYGVSKLDGVMLKGNKLNVVFYIKHVGPAILSGEVSEDKVFRFSWQVADDRGNGEVKWVNPWKVKAITPEQVTGTYHAIAWGPMEVESFTSTINLKVTGEEVKGRIVSPHGIFYITEGVYRQNRLRLICESEDDLKVLVVGTAGEMGIDLFWTVDYSTGRAALFKESSNFLHSIE